MSATEYRIMSVAAFFVLLLMTLGLPFGNSTTSTASASVTQPNVLAIHSMNWQTADYAQWINQLSGSPSFGSLTLFDAENATPTTTNLLGIDLVIISTGFDLLDTNAVGNLLADFVDRGGRVIVTTYSFACTLDSSGPVNWGIGGRWETEQYSPIIPAAARGGNCATYTWDAQQQMQVTAPSSPYMANVGAIVNQGSTGNTDINTDLAFASNATPLATWSTPANLPMAAFNDRCVFAVNFYPPRVVDFLAPSNASFNQMIKNFATVPCTPRSNQTPVVDTPSSNPAPLVTATFTG